MEWSFRTPPAQLHGLGNKKISGRCGIVFVDIPLLRKFSSGGDAGFERGLVTEALVALDVIAGQTLRLRRSKKSPPSSA
jgi:hypothetical protein